MRHLVFSALIMFVTLFGASAQSLRVMTYNIHNGVGLDTVRDHGRIAKVISAFKPDLVAIQEIDSVTGRSGGSYVLADIAGATGMTPIYAPAINYDGGRYGIGLLVNAKPDSVSRIALPGREEVRALVIAHYPGYSVACTHLSLTPDDALASVDIIKAEAKRLFPERPMILMGDFNSHPESAVIDSLLTDFDIVNELSAPTYPADNPTETIDYIMVSRQEGSSCAIREVYVVDETVASDHRPVAAVIELSPAAKQQ